MGSVWVETRRFPFPRPMVIRDGLFQSYELHAACRMEWVGRTGWMGGWDALLHRFLFAPLLLHLVWAFSGFTRVHGCEWWYGALGCIHRYIHPPTSVPPVWFCHPVWSRSSFRLLVLLLLSFLPVYYAGGLHRCNPSVLRGILKAKR